MITRRLRIRGRVQGVGFREALCGEALERGVAGWVRNRTDGSVEALFAGPADVIADLIARCRRGPSSAQVADVQAETVDSDALKLRRPGERFPSLLTRATTGHSTNTSSREIKPKPTPRFATWAGNRSWPGAIASM